MLLDPGNSHCCPIDELLFLDPRQPPQPRKRPQPVTCFEELRLEPLALGTLRSREAADTAYSKARERGHRAPVENREEQSNIEAKKKQTLCSPCIRLRALLTVAAESLVQQHALLGLTLSLLPGDFTRLALAANEEMGGGHLLVLAGHWLNATGEEVF